MFLKYIYNFLIFFLFLNLFTMISDSTFAQSSFWIKVNPKVIDAFTVDVDIITNISEEVIAAVSLALDGQKPDDIFIGTDMTRIRIKDGIGHVRIDGRENAYPTSSKLPAGVYIVEVDIYPDWKENKKICSRIGLEKHLQGTAKVKLVASGKSSNLVKNKADGRNWVMENVYIGKHWNPNTWKGKFGAWEEIKYNGELNPKIIKMYYFNQIDMTLMVNILLQEIVSYRDGRSSN